MADWPRPDKEVQRLREWCHVSQSWLDEAVRRVAQKVPEHARLGDGDSFGGEADLGGVSGHVVGGVKVEVRNLPEPACRKRKLYTRQISIMYYCRYTFLFMKSSIFCEMNFHPNFLNRLWNISQSHQLRPKVINLFTRQIYSAPTDYPERSDFTKLLNTRYFWMKTEQFKSSLKFRFQMVEAGA